MGPEQEEVLFQEDNKFFLKKKLKKLGLGLILFTVPPVALYFMCFYLLYWSSLFEKQTGAILIFLVLSPLVGLFFIVKSLFMRRMRIYHDRIPNPSLLGSWNIPLVDISLVATKYGVVEPMKVELHMKEGATSTRDKHLELGEFLESDRVEMMRVFNQMGVETGLR
jgi:hypothetical protein